MFSENIEQLNTVLAELQISLSKQEELVKLNRESTSQISELKSVMADGSAKHCGAIAKDWRWHGRIDRSRLVKI